MGEGQFSSLANIWLRALLKTNAAGILEAADLKDEWLLPSFNDQVNHYYHDDHDNHYHHDNHADHDDHDNHKNHILVLFSKHDIERKKFTFSSWNLKSAFCHALG